MTPAHDGPIDAEALAEDPAGSESRVSQGRSAPDWSRLTSTLTVELEERIRAVGGDPAHFERTWAELVEAYGPQSASNIVRLRAGQILTVEVEPELADKLAQLAHSRQSFLPSALSAQIVVPALPREGEDYFAAAGFEMPPPVRVRVEAASAAMRRELERVYKDPIVAEARLHLIATRDVATLSARQSEPERLGALRQDSPGGAIEPALAHARVAYAFHLSPTADHAHDLMAREAVDAVRRAAAEVERAAQALDRVIDLHGPALGIHLQGLRAGITARPEPSREVEQDDGASRELREGQRIAAGSQAVADEVGPPPGTAEPSSGDPAVEEASRAHEVLEEARILEKRGAELRAERVEVQRILSVLEHDDHEQLRARRDIDALAARVYQHPDRAVERWNRLVNDLEGDTDRAQKLIRANPGRLGPLNSEPAGWVQRLPLPGWIAEKIPFRSTAEARQHVPRLAERAVEYSKARQKAEGPLGWTTPKGTRLHSRAEVRAAAREIERGLGAEIDQTHAALLARGNVAGAEREAQRAISSLKPDQQSTLARRLAAVRGVPAAEMMAALSRLASAPRVAAQVARLTRTVAEGPGGGQL